MTMSNCDEFCPVARANDVLGGKWTTLIIRDLLPGKKRYSELQRSLVGI
ncbi:winged helix-turn-helix transcriptional regulator, partial [Maritalea sp.]